MGFLYQWYGEGNNTCTYWLADKQISVGGDDQHG